MKIYYVSFATHNYGGALTTQKKLSKQALQIGGVDKTLLYRENDISEFLEKAKKLFKNVKNIYPRLKNSSYFVWKPYIILKTFEQIDDGDFVIYHDAGRECYRYRINLSLRPFCEYVSKNHKGLFVNFGPFKNVKYTKQDCFEKMKCTDDFYKNHNQANASFGIYQKNKYVKEFVSEWLNYCMDDSCIVTDLPSKTPEDSRFDAHRHDQSILTNLLLKYNKTKSLPLDPKLSDKKINPHGFEKDMCGVIRRISAVYDIKIDTSIKNVKKQIVISRYKENLKWITSLDDEFEVVVYNKGDSDIDGIVMKRINKLVEVKNVGREGHTHLTHIIDNYDDLADITLFTQGNPSPHLNEFSCSLNSFFDNLEQDNANRVSYMNILPNKKCRDHILYNDNNKPPKHCKLALGKRWGTERSELHELPSWWTDIVGYVFPLKEQCKFSYHGTFSVSASYITYYPKKYYEKIRNSLSYSVNPEEGHFLERAWSTIFNPVSHLSHHPVFIKNKNVVSGCGGDFTIKLQDDFDHKKMFDNFRKVQTLIYETIRAYNIISEFRFPIFTNKQNVTSIYHINNFIKMNTGQIKRILLGDTNVKIQPTGKDMIIFLTHKFNRVLIDNIKNLTEKSDVVILFDKSANMSSHYNSLSYQNKKIIDSVMLIEGDRTKINYDPLGGHSMYYNFFKENSAYLEKYEHIWVFENDVYYTGDIIQLVSSHKHMKQDVLVSEFGGREPKWRWETEGLSDNFKELYDYTGVLACVCRFSSKYMKIFIQDLDTKFSGYLEIIIPLICQKYNLSIAQIIPNYIGKSYHIGSYATDIISNKIQENVHPSKYPRNKLYHPIKL